MSTNCTQLPATGAVAELLESLLGLDISVSEHTGSDVPAFDLVATFKNSSDEDVAFAISDFAFANGVAAALARVPASAAEESTKAKECPDNLFSNFCEVMNISATLLADASSQRVVLSDTQISPAGFELPKGAELVQFSVDLGNYGVGRFVFATKS